MKNKFNQLLALVMLLIGGLTAYAADFTASGTVTDDSNEPLIGVSIVVKGQTGYGVTTDIDGNFKIRVPEGSTL